MGAMNWMGRIAKRWGQRNRSTPDRREKSGEKVATKPIRTPHRQEPERAQFGDPVLLDPARGCDQSDLHISVTEAPEVHYEIWGASPTHRKTAGSLIVGLSGVVAGSAFGGMRCHIEINGMAAAEDVEDLERRGICGYVKHTEHSKWLDVELTIRDSLARDLVTVLSMYRPPGDISLRLRIQTERRFEPRREGEGRWLTFEVVHLSCHHEDTER